MALIAGLLVLMALAGYASTFIVSYDRIDISWRALEIARRRARSRAPPAEGQGSTSTLEPARISAEKVIAYSIVVRVLARRRETSLATFRRRMPPVTLSFGKGLGRTAYFAAGVTLFILTIALDIAVARAFARTYSLTRTYGALRSIVIKGISSPSNLQANKRVNLSPHHVACTLRKRCAGPACRLRGALTYLRY